MKTKESLELQYIETIKNLMRLTDTTVNDIADLINVGRGTVHNYFGGRTAMKVDDLQKIADHFDVSLSTLFTGLKKGNPGHEEPDLQMKLDHINEMMKEKDHRIEEMKLTIESLQNQLSILKDFYTKFSERDHG